MNMICVKWGTKYGPEYVDRLYHMVTKNVTKPFDFYCITDDSTGINQAIKIIPITDDFLESYWNKMRLFTPGSFKGKCFYLDLDTVIQSNIDCFLDYTDKFCGVYTYWNDIYTDGSYPYATLKYKTPFNSSILSWNAEEYYWLWDKFMTDPDWFIIKYYGDDKFLGNEIKEKTTFPREWIYSRLYGSGDNRPNDALTDNNFFQYIYFQPEKKICLFNGPTRTEHYDRYKRYWS